MEKNSTTSATAITIYQNDSVLDLAKDYVLRGLAPVPVAYMGKTPTKEATGWAKEGFKHEELARLFNHPRTNIGIVLGPRSGGLIDIDVDDDVALSLAPIFLPSTGMIFGRKSRPRSHYIYRCSESGYKKYVRPDAEDPKKSTIVELRGTSGHQSVFPGSIHESGEEVFFDFDGEPAYVAYDKLELACVQIALATMLRRNWRPGQRHGLALATSGLLAKANWKLEDAVRLIEAVASDASDDDVEDRLKAVRDTFANADACHSVAGYQHLAEVLGRKTADTLQTWVSRGEDVLLATPLSKQDRALVDVSTDLRAAEAFADAYKEKLIYSNEAWFRRENDVFRPIDPVRTQGVAMQFVRDIGAEITSRLPNMAARTQLESHSRISSLVKLSRSLLQVESARIDAARNLFGLADGSVFDLDRMELTTGGAGVVTKCLGAVYDPNASCPTWHKFLGRVFNNQTDVISFLQRAVGYTLSGHVGEHCMFVLIGTGANGKSTFITALNNLFGEYAATIPMHSLMQRANGSEQTNDLAMLPGKRFVSASEGEAGQKLAESRVKLMTGGDRVTARPLYREYFEYDPQFKLWLGTNSFPAVTGWDNAIWRRIKVIEFPVTIPEAERDHDLNYRLQEELPGILNWALHGYRDWKAHKLQAPEQVKGVTGRYRAENDPVEQFIEACCDRSPRLTTPTKALFDAYSIWCQHNGHQPLAVNMFGRALSTKNFQKKTGSRFNSWQGLGLKTG